MKAINPPMIVFADNLNPPRWKDQLCAIAEIMRRRRHHRKSAAALLTIAVSPPPAVVGCSLLPERQLRLLQVGRQQNPSRRPRAGVAAGRVLLCPLRGGGSRVHR